MGKENSEVLMMYGIHSPDFLENLKGLRHELEMRLAGNIYSKVYQLIEVTSMTEVLAENVGNLVDMGANPINAFFYSHFFLRYDRYPDKDELIQHTDKIMNDRDKLFLQMN